MRMRNSLLAVLIASLPLSAHAGHVTPPAVPGEIVIDADVRAYLEGHAIGTQNYVCLPSGTGFAWSLFTPEATLFDDHGRQITTHFFGPIPGSPGVIRAAWQHSRDTSTFWGLATGQSTDAHFVAPGAIPWVRLERAAVQDGPTGGDRLSVATFVHRVNTFGGSAPATGCAATADVGKRAFVPYTADYIFYTNRDRDDEITDDDGN